VSGSGSPDERARRWRLVLGPAAEEPLGRDLGADDLAMDAALGELYEPGADPDGSVQKDRTGGLAGSAPRVIRWLGDIRRYFPAEVVRILQQDAVERLDLTRLLLEPEVLRSMEPDVRLAGTLLTLSRVMPQESRETAREVIRRVVADVERRIALRTRAAVTGALDRSAPHHRPRPGEVDWNRTVLANLEHYLPERRVLVPRRLIGHRRARKTLGREVVLAVDQSASMAESVVHASVFAAVLAALPTLRTALVAFDTAVVDLTEQLHDPVEVLLGVQLGGGTDIDRAVAYCETLIRRPHETLLILVSDLFEGGPRDGLLPRVARLLARGVRVIVLLALSDSGVPAYDHETATALAGLGVPAFAATPDTFPELLAAALAGRELTPRADRPSGRA